MPQLAHAHSSRPRSPRADSCSKIADVHMGARSLVLHRPGEGEVGYRFPAFLAAGVVAPTGKLDVRRDRGILLLQTVVRLVHCRRHDVVLAGGDEQQWRAAVALEV